MPSPTRTRALQHVSEEKPRYQTTLPNNPEPAYAPPSTTHRILTALRVAVLPPWLHVKHGSYLELTLTGQLPESSSLELTLPDACRVLQGAAHDPRIAGLVLRCPGGLRIGWAKLQELRRHVSYFRASGKPTTALIERGGEREYYAATACAHVFALPCAQLVLTGFAMSGTCRVAHIQAFVHTAQGATGWARCARLAWSQRWCAAGATSRRPTWWRHKG